MRKIIVKFILIFFVFNLYSYDGEEIVENTNDADYKIGELQRELDILKRDVEEIKNKNLWFSFNFEGSTKTIFGAALWTRDGVTLNKNFPVTLGFDFENNIRMGMDIANKVVASNSYKSVEGTEISAKLKINSNGLRRIKPEGSYYVMDATDDQGRKVKVYFPRYSGSSSNIVFGNFEVIFEEAKIKNIMGTGVFISYKDVFEVQQYYGVTSLVDVLKLNHKYFNNGFNGNDNDVLYYSFDDRYYQPEAVESVAVRYWSENTLFNNPSNSDANQNPHGISLGYEGKISDGVEAYVEGGGASKDAFDPKYFVDEQIDAGFFLKGSIHFHNKKFSFHPKLAFSFAFQTGTLEDKAPA
nr:hypothetical protein [Spirochaetota bacterium]